MPFQVFVLFDFMVQLNIDWMPVEVFMQAAPRLLQVLAVAEGTSAGSQICTLIIRVTIQTLHTITTPNCASCAIWNVLPLKTYQCLTTDAELKYW